MGLIRWITWAFLRWLVWLRYRIRVVGLRQVRARPGPYLILANHPSFSDPICVLSALWPAFRMRPMLLETNFQNPVLAPFAYLLRAIRIPDTERASQEARERAASAIAEAIGALRLGQNVILWPSGRLQRQPLEKLGATRAASDILAAVPEVTLVLVRTRGLWGSLFSWAYAKKPDLFLGMLKAAGILLVNLIVLAPRRRVTLTLQAFTPSERPAPQRELINRWMESWFNALGPEPPTFVPYFRHGRQSFHFPPPVDETPVIELSRIQEATRREVARILEEKLKRRLSDDENRAATTFQDLGLDSLERMEVSLAVEERFGFHSDHLPQTLGELWALAEGQLSGAPPKPPAANWFTRPSDNGSLEILAETIPAAFVERAFRHPQDVAVADDLAGAITYEKLLLGAMVISRRLRENIPADNVGLLLPAAVGADIAFFAIALAGKLPVLLNWTTGPANLNHAARIMDLTHVVTSRAFVDRTGITVKDTRLLFLEDLRARISKPELLGLLLRLRLFPSRIKHRILAGLDPNPRRIAVVLFTSGSEKAPKAVPLSHANIIADQRAAISALHISRQDSGMAFLPLFHSFGLTITGLLPLLVGVRVVRHPDPTDASAIARKIRAYRTTLMAGTPTFLSRIFERGQPGEFVSLRLIVCGAEKAPDSLFDQAAVVAPHADVLEGYGITECSPVVSVNLPGHIRRGTVGPPLPGVLVSVRDLETQLPVPQGCRGMLHVAGPTVFSGYLGWDGPQPFFEAEGQRWFVTGDLAAIDEAGYIVFHGRLKRFLKAAGEMISLPALEEPFTRLYPPTDDGPRVAVEGIDGPCGRRIVLFTTEHITLDEANALLRREGYQGIMRLDEVRRLERIPTLGTGKTDYKVLRQMLESLESVGSA